MKAYADTSFLLKLLSQDQGSDVGPSVFHARRKAAVVPSYDADHDCRFVLPRLVTGELQLDHAGGVERRGEVHGEEGSESKESLGFRQINLISTELRKWRGKSDGKRRRSAGR